MGPFSILDLTKESGSPFNVSERVDVQCFTSDEVVQLFRSAAEDRLMSLEDVEVIARDIFLLTEGCV